MRQAFVGATIIDATGARPIADGVLIVDGDRITAVGPRAGTTIPGDAIVHDLAGRTLLPGLVNTHDHLGLPDPSDTSLDYAAEARLLHSSPGEYRQTWALRYGAQELRDGITTIRILGERDYLDLNYKETFDRDLAPGPRVIPSGPAIATSAQFHGTWVSVIADGVEDLRAAVRRSVVRDVKVIKLIMSGGRRQGVPKGLTTCYFSREEIHAIIDEAHKFDVKVCAHLNGGIGVDWSIEAGIDGIEHAMVLSDHELELIARSGTYVGLTMGWHFTELYRKLLGDQRDNVEREVRRLWGAGVKMGLGNDEVHHDHGMARQMILLTEFGVPNKDVVEIATRHGAIACGVEATVGTLEVGKLADVIAVPGDPLEDMRVMRDVEVVMKGGRIYHGLGQPLPGGV
jgi:imidazolonepropionase-like amidohydrolase